MDHSKPKPRRATVREIKGGSVLGKKASAAIAAVEGLRLKTASKKRLAELSQSKLSPEEKRAEVLRAYVPTKRKK